MDVRCKPLELRVAFRVQDGTTLSPPIIPFMCQNPNKFIPQVSHFTSNAAVLHYTLAPIAMVPAKVIYYLVSLSLSFLCLSYGHHQKQEEVEEGGQCRIQNLKPEEPSYIIKAEAAFTEVWKINNNQGFRCVGAAMFRHSIQPGGFLLPSYASSHLLGFVEQVTNGEAKIQVVNHRGQRLLDDNNQVKRGQVVALPMGYAVVIRAGNQGFEWVIFHTNHNAMLSGHFSTFQGVPAYVLGLACQVSWEQAMWFQYGRDESILFSPSDDDDEQKFSSE